MPEPPEIAVPSAVTKSTVTSTVEAELNVTVNTAIVVLPPGTNPPSSIPIFRAPKATAAPLSSPNNSASSATSNIVNRLVSMPV